MNRNRKTINIWFFTGIAVLAAGVCFARNDTAAQEELFSRGNSFYESGEYIKAIGEYEKIVVSGYESGPVYYNLAGAYFKSGQLGRAILNYERAKNIIPEDADLMANYKFALATINSKVILRKGIWAWRPLRMYLECFTIDTLTLMSSGVYVAIMMLLLMSLVWSAIRRYRMVCVLILSMFVAGNSVVCWHKINDMKTGAITVVSRADVLFAPFDSATKFFNLHEGMKVAVLQVRDKWAKVKRVDGKIGWIKTKDVERIQSNEGQ